MATAISSLTGLQLNVLQLPEVARLEVPILAQAQLANAQVPAIIQHGDQQASETIQVLREADSHTVGDSLGSSTRRERPSYREPSRQQGHGFQAQAVILAATHPRGLGQLVDFRA